MEAGIEIDGFCVFGRIAIRRGPVVDGAARAVIRALPDESE